MSFCLCILFITTGLFVGANRFTPKMPCLFYSASRSMVLWCCCCSLVKPYRFNFAHEYFKYESLHKDIRFKAANFVGATVTLPKSQWLFLTQLKAFAVFTQTLATKNMSDAELLKMQQVAYRYPMPPVLFRYALALKLNDREQEANRILEKIYSFNGKDMYCESIQNMQLMGFYQNGLPTDMEARLLHCKN
ncbi:MAG: Wzy polymerase domain-containing protein [Marinagarivorans sp.]|nr:Wzy polymerase domain-containing protein [Marinagarivorans sp.]